MKDIGIVTLLSVVAVAAAPSSRAGNSAPLVTTKSTAQFADCFAKAQDRRSSAWWFVPKDHGGTISNLGAKSVRNPYFIVISDHGSRREIQLQNAGPQSPQGREVNQCI